MAKINGEEVLADGSTVKSYLIENGFSLDRIAVERNEEILPKALYDQTIIEKDDTIEVVSFVGGG